MSKMKTRVANLDACHENDGYEKFEQSIRKSMKAFGDVPLFQTNVNDLWDLYLTNIPKDSRQYYNCNACRKFIERYGGLVTISPGGETHSVMWQGDDVPGMFKASVEAMRQAIGKAKVTGVFLSKDELLGTPVTGEWTHMHAILPSAFQERLHTVDEVMAEKTADFILLKKSMRAYPVEAINQALLLLRADALYRSEKVLGVAEWFKLLHDACHGKNGKLRDNIIWRAVALAPPGYCHLKNTVIGTMLDDIVSGMSLDDVAHRFATKMHPLQYQRPQAAPSEGSIDKAERIVAKLGIERSLVRRFARLDEVQAVWRPIEKPIDEKEGVFSHLVPKGKTTIQKYAPTVTITWKKFAETVLPDALYMEVLVPSHGKFMAILTAEHMDAPPIIQWDCQEHRNPCSWYCYNNGSYARDWGISEGWQNVTAICLYPSMWQDGYDHQGTGALFIIEGARDSEKNCGNALFPEFLKADLREIRSVISAYSKQAEIRGYENASACGIYYERATVRVKSKLGTVVYKIDRWD